MPRRGCRSRGAEKSMSAAAGIGGLAEMGDRADGLCAVYDGVPSAVVLTAARWDPALGSGDRVTRRSSTSSSRAAYAARVKCDR